MLTNKFRVASQAVMWGEWFSGGPLLVFITVSLVDKAEFSSTDFIMIISFFLCLLFGFIPIIPQPYWLGIFWLVLACLSFLPILYLPYHVSYRIEDFIDVETNSKNFLIKRKKQMYYLAVWLTICLPLFPVNYLLAMSGVIGPGDTIAIYLILSVLTKALYAAVTMDVHSSALTEAQSALMEERNANEARRAFLKYIFHEVRTPLNSLTMGLEILKQGDRLNSSDLELLSMMKVASDFMADTLNDVLSLQKIEEGKLELELSPFSISDSVSKVLSTCHAAVVTKRIRIEKDIASDVPDRLIGDRYRVEHVLSNLLSNAIKFSPDGELIQVIVKALSTTSNGSSTVAHIAVSVIDHGPGISPENQKRLFGNFVQIRPGQLQRGQGSGLGLSLCKQISTLHGGTIGVESTEGQGSTFTFCIPFAVFSGSAFEPNKSVHAEEVASVRQSAVRVNDSTIEGTSHVRHNQLTFDTWYEISFLKFFSHYSFL